VRTLAPWSFWRAVKLSFPLRPRRLGLALALVVLLTYSAGVLLALAALVGSALAQAMPLGRLLRGLASPSAMGEYLGWPADNEARFIFLVWLTPSLIAPACFVFLPDTLGRAKVRPGHVLRATVYTIIPIPTLCFLEHLLRVAARVETQADLFGWHARSFTGGTWRPAPTLVGQAIESMTWGAFVWPLLWPIWMLVMWWCVCRLYFRIRHALATAILLLVIAFLATLVVGGGIGALLEST
jgi:hypothetical protein